MKLILIIFDADKEKEVYGILDSSGVSGFTTWGPVYGKGKQSDPRMGTQVWPGDNRIIMTAIPDEDAVTLKEALLSHDEIGSGKGVKVLELTASTLI